MIDGRRRRTRGKPGRKPKGETSRRVPPPETTGRQGRFLRGLKDDETPLVVKLMNGEIHHGHIEYLDRDMIKLTRPEGPNVFIRTSDVRYVHEDG